MKNPICSFFLMLFGLFSLGSVIAQNTEYLPLSTSSSEAAGHYHKALKATEEFDLDTYFKNMEAALQIDPDFFMAYAQQGFFQMSQGQMEEAKKAFGKAMAVNADLNKGEKEIKEAIEAISGDSSADIGPYGDALAKLYPDCVEAHLWKGYLNFMSQKVEPAIVGFRTVLKLNPEMTNMHNMLGYAYMSSGNMEKAKMHFEAYQAAHSGHPNPYDSLGDYYMAVKDYKNAEKYYRKAYEMDNSWTASKERAEKARQMMEGDQ